MLTTKRGSPRISTVVRLAIGSMMASISAAVLYVAWAVATEPDSTEVAVSYGQYFAFALLPLFFVNCYASYWGYVLVLSLNRITIPSSVLIAAVMALLALVVCTAGYIGFNEKEWGFRKTLALYAPFAVITLPSLAFVVVAAIRSKSSPDLRS